MKIRTEVEPGVDPTATRVEFSPFEALTGGLLALRYVIPGALVGMLLAALFTFLVGIGFQAQSAFRPAVSEASLSRLSGLAAQFGFAMPSGDAGSLDFYARLTKSNTILAAIAVDTFTISGSDSVASGSYIELAGIEARDSAELLRDALEDLRSRIGTRIDASSGIVELTTTASSEDLAVKLNRRILANIDWFNREQLQQQASAERQFVESRLDTAHQALRTAEDGFRTFLERNRTYQSSPELAFEAARMQRDIELAQQVYLGLATSAEQARIEEVRNTPLITVVDAPENGLEPTSSWITRLIGGALLGGLLGGAVAMTRLVLTRYRQEDPAGYAAVRTGFWNSR